VKEPVSGIIINGESALNIFFKSLHFDDFVVKECRTFEHCHHVPIDDREDDSIRPSQHSSSDNESLFSKRECPTPKFLSRLVQVSISSTFYACLFRTKVICAAFLLLQFGFVIFWQKLCVKCWWNCLQFVETVLVGDQSASKRMKESFQSFPQMYSKLLPALSSLAFDTADKMNQNIMIELAPGMRYFKAPL